MAATATPSFIRSRNRILIASADPAFRERVRKGPEFGDSLSEDAVGGAHALAKLLEFPCDSVLIDRNLPDLDASEVAEQIRKQFPRIEVELLDSRTVDSRAVNSQPRANTRGDSAATAEAKAESATARMLAEERECGAGLSIAHEDVSPRTVRQEGKLASAKTSEEAVASECHERDEARAALYDEQGATNAALAEEHAANAALHGDGDEMAAVATEPIVEALPGMIGASRVMQQVYRLVRMVAPRDTTVLVTGETGTGKELVAEAIHHLSRRSRHPFVVVNCAAIPEALLEAELFGHARGAFTGAVQSRLGRIHVAQGGTLFLDEVGELPLSMQAKLLRFLQNGEVQRLGSSDVYRVDVRVVCATNVRLRELVQKKQFRLDLYYRLEIFPIAVPPLRERPEDIAALTEHFLEKLSSEAGVGVKRLTRPALTFLEKAWWGGNVRELQHAIERAFILAGNETRMGVEHFQAFGETSPLREL